MPNHMTDDEKREQVAKQCEALAHMANTLNGIYNDYVRLLRAGGLVTIVDQVGERTAHQMEALGNMLNGMDAVDEVEDEWLNPVFNKAHEIWPHKADA